MFSGLELFQTASALLDYSVARQSAIGQNIANADTPNYKARDLPSFENVFSKNLPDLELRTTRVAHDPGADMGFDLRLRDIHQPGHQSPNGNSVSLEAEMMRSAEVQYSHDLALTVYRSGLTLLRSSLGGGR